MTPCSNRTDSIPAGVEGPLRDQLAELRSLLAEKFPAARKNDGGILPTGLSTVDEVEGGLRRAALTEFVGSSGGGSMFLHALLQVLSHQKCFGALVDAACNFEPDTCSSGVLSRMLWVRCPKPAMAIRATDLLLRDGNMSLILLDLQLVSFKELRRIPASTWHRFQRLAEQTTAAVVIFTPQPLVESAHVRIMAPERWTLQAQRSWREDLASSMPLRVFPRRALTSGTQPSHHEAQRTG